MKGKDTTRREAIKRAAGATAMQAPARGDKGRLIAKKQSAGYCDEGAPVYGSSS
jgi:hypothetical protein